MNKNERVRYLRDKVLHLTMEQFGEKIGVKKAAISKLENGKTGLSDHTIKSIHMAFGVSEKWLRTGEGDIFLNSQDEENLQQLVDDILTDVPGSFRRRFASMLSRLTDDQWQTLSDICDMLLDDGSNPFPSASRDKGEPSLSGLKSPADMSEKDIQKAAGDFADQLREEKNQAEKSSASGIIRCS